MHDEATLIKYELSSTRAGQDLETISFACLLNVELTYPVNPSWMGFTGHRASVADTALMRAKKEEFD